jgi:hypothetical protein
VLLAVAGIKLLPPTALQQPTAVHQLLHGAGYFNASLDSSAAAQYAAASANGQPSPAGTGPSAERRLRVLVLGHDLSLTGAPQALLEIARHLRDQGHTLRCGRRLRDCTSAAATKSCHAAAVPHPGHVALLLQLHVPARWPAEHNSVPRELQLHCHHRRTGVPACVPRGC